MRVSFPKRSWSVVARTSPDARTHPQPEPFVGGINTRYQIEIDRFVTAVLGMDFEAFEQLPFAHEELQRRAVQVFGAGLQVLDFTGLGVVNPQFTTITDDLSALGLFIVKAHTPRF